MNRVANTVMLCDYEYAALRRDAELGSKLREQGFGCPGFAAQPNRAKLSCALQAAVEAVTGRLVKDPCIQAQRIFGFPSSISRSVWEMNDVERISREEIADWLEAQGL